ncbi:Laminin subunit gamma-3 [Bienertia sinuspersici]
MKKLLDFGRKALFYVRVLSGYEERRIRSYRLNLEKRLRLAQEKKIAVTKVPEQIMLSEVRRMVQEMQNLNKQLEDMENDINEYFKPIDKEVETLMNLQMEKDKATAEMMGSMYKQALLEKAETQAKDVDGDNQAKMETMSAMFKQALLQKAEAEVVAEVKNPLKQIK